MSVYVCLWCVNVCVFVVCECMCVCGVCVFVVCVSSDFNTVNGADIIIELDSYHNMVTGNGIQLKRSEHNFIFGDDVFLEGNHNIFIGGGHSDDGKVNIKGNNIILLGQGAKVSSGLSDVTAIGTDSYVDREGTISFGNDLIKRQLVNVEAGTQAHDAVNLSQMNNAINAATAAIPTNTGPHDHDVAYNVFNQRINFNADRIENLFSMFGTGPHDHDDISTNTGLIEDNSQRIDVNEDDIETLKNTPRKVINNIMDLDKVNANTNEIQINTEKSTSDTSRALKERSFISLQPPSRCRSDAAPKL